MADIQGTIAGLLDAPAKIKQFVIEPLKDQFSYLCCFNSILESLEAEVQELENTRSNVQQHVAVARENLETIRPHVEKWLKKAEEIEKKKNRIFAARPEVQEGCVNGSCPNLKLRYSISRKVKKMTTGVVDLVQSASTYDSVADHADPPARTPFVSGSNFDSRKNIEEKIIAALRDDKVYLFGICGMGGVGKTTMAKKIKEYAEKEILFCVAMAAVSQQLDLKKIQQEIAEALGLKLEQETESNRARRLHQRLIQEKSILIIIDDIWEKIKQEDLESLPNAITKDAKSS